MHPATIKKAYQMTRNVDESNNEPGIQSSFRKNEEILCRIIPDKVGIEQG